MSVPTASTQTSMRRLLGLVRHHPGPVAAVLLCSFTIALLWGGNIGALYPVFKVTISGESLQDSIANEIRESKERIAKLEQKIESATCDDKPDQALQRSVDLWHSELKTQQSALQSAQKIKPWVDQYLPHDPFHTLVLVVLLLLSVIVIRQVLLISSSLLHSRLKGLISIRLQEQFFARVLGIDLATLGSVGPSGMLTHIKDTEKVSSGVAMILVSGIREPAKMLVCLVGAGLICWQLLLFTVILAPVAALVIHLLGQSIRRTSDETFQINRDVKRVLYDVLTSLPIVQLSSAEQYEQERFKGHLNEAVWRRITMSFYVSLSKAFTEVFALGTVCAALIAGAYLVLSQETHILGIQMTDRPLSLASILVFYGLLMGMNDPLRRFGHIYTELQRTRAAADRLFPLLDRPSAIQELPDPVPVSQPLRCIEFNDVSLEYTKGTPVLSSVNLRIDAGTTLAIIGNNGSGKSSLVNLLPRFYDPSHGTVAINGVDLRSLRLKDLRGTIGYVMQTPVLFDGTVRENISYGIPDATDAQIVAAAQSAQAHRFICDALPHGYDTQVGVHGGQLSGGQRQRLCLARLMLRDPAIVILDEATSQVDLQGESDLHEILSDFLQHRTALIVTHRQSTLRLADQIAVMQAGKVVTVGTHDELIRDCNFYQDLRNMERSAA